MTDASVDNVDKLRNFLSDQGFHVDEIENGIRIRLDTGPIIDINALIRDSDFFWASFETTKAQPDRIKAVIQNIRSTIAKGLDGLATIGKFEETQDADDRFVFVADIEISPSVTYDGVIFLDDAHEEPVQPASAPQAPKPAPDVVPEPEVRSGRNTAAPAPELMTAEKAVELLDSVDGKMLRQSLDMMNLRRSSNVRIALTRIFRSATDPKELIASVREEAEKITTSEDRSELEMLKILSANGFLQPVVDLLWQEVQK